ncbi:MAG: FecCD family ABC transporter permease [Lachnospiraceae bacterium]
MTEKTNHVIMKGYKKRRRRRLLVCLLLICLLLVLAVIMLTYGNTVYSPETVLRVLQGEEIQGAVFAIKTLRLPRLIIGVLAGLAFGMAGSTFQTLLRNDLASPDIIGVSSGSGAAAVFCLLVLRLSGSIVSIAALVAGLVVAAVIYFLAQGKSFSKARLILIGIGVQAMLDAVISFVLLKGAQYDVAMALRWLSGSLNGVQMSEVPGLLLVVIVCGIFLTILARHLQVLQLGEDTATTLGVRVHKLYLPLLFSAVIMVAFATSVTGPIASVAFLSGPIASRLTGKGGSNTIPAGLVGAVLVLAADLIGQYVLGTRYPVGVITGVLGAPYMLFLLIRVNKKGGNT